MPDVTFSAKAESKSHTKTVVNTRDFTITIDEPENLGGKNEGPNPVEYVLAGLAGCLNVVGNLVAQEMDININNLSFELEGDLNPAKFSGKSDKDRAGYKEIRVKINIDSDADRETLQKWMEKVEDRCPVSDNISNNTPLKISLN